MINFAVIGVGSFGKKRASAIQSTKSANLKAICDIDIKKAAAVSKDLNVPNLKIEDILNDSSIDVVCICAPNKFHKDLIIKSLESEKNVFCEKPLARNLSEAKEILEASKKFNKKIQIGSNHRYFESVMFAKDLVNKGTIGKVLSFNGRIGHDGERIKDSWFWNKELSGGGTLLDNGCHLLDLSRYFVGQFSSGTGFTTNSYWKKDIAVEDTASAIFKTDKNQTASIFCSWRLLSGYFFFEINGTDGYINVDGRFDTHGGDKIFWTNKEGKEIFNKDFSNIKPNSYAIEIEKFIERLENNQELSPSIEDGVEVMKMIDYVYSSNN